MEACGFLFGRDGRVEEAIQVKNRAADNGHFVMDPPEQVRALYEIQDAQLDVLAVYHSHPAGPAGPSATDSRELSSTGWDQVILHPVGGSWRIRGFIWAEGTYRSLPIDIVG